MSTAPPKANKAQNQAQKTQAEIKINHKQAIATNYKNQWWLPIIILVMHCAMAHVAPQEGGNEDFEFDPKLLLNGMPADLTQFSRANAIAPGTYRADVYLNQKWLANTDILMIRPTAETTTRPCLDPELVRLLQIEAPAGHGGPESSAQSNDASSRCRYWDQILGAGQADFDLSTQSLQISVPQAYLKKMGTGSIPEEMLDDGITAGSISYQFNTYHGSGSQGQSQSAYLGLNNSFNMGAWRFRNQGSFQQSSGGTHYQKIANYVNRDIFSIKSQISLGQIFTEGQLLRADSTGRCNTLAVHVVQGDSCEAKTKDLLHCRPKSGDVGGMEEGQDAPSDRTALRSTSYLYPEHSFAVRWNPSTRETTVLQGFDNGRARRNIQSTGNRRLDSHYCQAIGPSTVHGQPGAPLKWRLSSLPSHLGRRVSLGTLPPAQTLQIGD